MTPCTGTATPPGNRVASVVLMHTEEKQMTTAKAYTATSATDPLVPTTIERRTVGANDVSIDIAYSGVCHSDIHTVRGDWGPVPYPLTVDSRTTA
jgi:hypothetical protein